MNAKVRKEWFYLGGKQRVCRSSFRGLVWWQDTKLTIVHADIVNMNTMEFDVELDARKLSCPLPILRTKKMLAQMEGGQVLKVVATDSKSPDDFADFCKQTGNVLLSASSQGEEFIFYLRRRQT